MKGVLAVVVALVVLAVVVSGKSSVIELDESNFESRTFKGTWLVEFYAPWCGHCKKLIPTYEEVATNLEGDVNVAKVDGSKHKGLAKQFGVKGFPTIILIQNSRMLNYNGDRNAEDIATFALKPLTKTNSQPVPPPVKLPPPRPPVEEEEIDLSKSQVVLLESDNAANLLNNGSEWLVEFYAPWCGFCKRLTSTWEKLAISLKDKNSSIKVAKIDGVAPANRGLSRAFNIEHFPQIFFIRPDGMREYTAPERTVEALEDYVTKYYKSSPVLSVPTISFINQYLGYFDLLLEPWNEWINENIVYVTVGIIGGGLLIGAMIGKLTMEIIRANRDQQEDEEEEEEQVEGDKANTAAAAKPKAVAKTKDGSEAKKTK
eukprot:TRINITY_DN7663_c0_g1_i2.p1 TRINITY_DN7663_c0_g1~~TRINITY_DN7663_c0_g1_i2.p1  ORF type:complete len:373 (+),score=110.59 TRINITY_DN7663_c0_g1_i2:26-1144(+)